MANRGNASDTAVILIFRIALKNKRSKKALEDITFAFKRYFKPEKRVAMPYPRAGNSTLNICGGRSGVGRIKTRSPLANAYRWRQISC